MKVIVIRRDGFGVIQIDNVSSIAFSSNTYTITATGGTTTYSADDYRVSIVW